MNELELLCKSFKSDFAPRIKDSKRPVRCWSEKDFFNGKVVDTFVIIFRTRGCSWALNSGCSMCGYFNDSLWDNVSDKDLLFQFDSVMKKYSNEKFVKIFTSGSFLDDTEISPYAKDKILTILKKNADKISVESRPNYITNKSLSNIRDVLNGKTFEVGVGLESSNDFILKNSINKGFTFKDYKAAANNLKKFNYLLKTYVLLKPPFLTEKESINDSVKTIKDIDSYTDIISLNPTNVQRNTLVNYLWKRKQYRPPWIWSIIEVLRQSKKITNKPVKCDVVGGGSIRGAHNCRICDKNLIKLIEKFSLSQDISIFNDINCGCKDRWFDQLDIENLCFGSLVDFSRSVI